MADAVESPYFIFPPELPVNGANMPLKSERSTEQKTGWRRRGWTKGKEKIEEEEVVKRSYPPPLLSLSLWLPFEVGLAELINLLNLNVADKFLFIL